jgi:hypothetical protein
MLICTLMLLYMLIERCEEELFEDTQAIISTNSKFWLSNTCRSMFLLGIVSFSRIISYSSDALWLE